MAAVAGLLATAAAFVTAGIRGGGGGGGGGAAVDGLSHVAKRKMAAAHACFEPRALAKMTAHARLDARMQPGLFAPTLDGDYHPRCGPRPRGPSRERTAPVTRPETKMPLLACAGWNRTSNGCSAHNALHVSPPSMFRGGGERMRGRCVCLLGRAGRVAAAAVDVGGH